jgi:hypothetical protein
LKFIRSLAEFNRQVNWPITRRLPTYITQDKCGHTSTHVVSFDPTTPVALRLHRVQATSFISTLINQLVFVFS